jgi:hypothetical protein
MQQLCNRIGLKYGIRINVSACFLQVSIKYIQQQNPLDHILPYYYVYSPQNSNSYSLIQMNNHNLILRLFTSAKLRNYSRNSLQRISDTAWSRGTQILGATWKYVTRVGVQQETSAFNTKIETLIDKIEKTKRKRLPYERLWDWYRSSTNSQTKLNSLYRYSCSINILKHDFCQFLRNSRCLTDIFYKWLTLVYTHFKNTLIIHEENTKKNHKRVVYLYMIEISLDIHKL